MSRVHKVSKREQNGSLTSEPDSSVHSAPRSNAPSGEQSATGRSTKGERLNGSRNRKAAVSDKGPDTSTPEKLASQPPPSSTHSANNTSSGQAGRVRRSLVDDLNSTNASSSIHNTSTSSTAEAVRRVNQAAQALAAGAPYSPAVSSIRHDSTINSTFDVSTGTSKRSFVSEYENGTIQAQRHELQMLMTELKDRDRELNEMVKAHHQQLLGWEEDRQRILTLENRNTQLEADAKRKNEQVRALVARLKTMESMEQAKQGTLEHTQNQLSSVTEQLSTTQLKLKETQEKSRKMSDMVKELSSTMSKLETKEHEMLNVLKLKDKDLTAASSHLSELSSKLKSMDVKLREKTQAEASALKDAAEWKEKYSQAKRVADKLKSDLNRSQLDEEESRLEVDRVKRDQERLRKQIRTMADREKRQEELINSQKLKQERTNAELTSIRQLYERQQRDLSLLHLNLDSAKELLTKQNDSDKADNGNISLLLQSPTSGRTVAYYTGENTVTLPHSKTHSVATTDFNNQVQMSSLCSDSPHLAAVGPGQLHHQQQATTDTKAKQSLTTSSIHKSGIPVFTSHQYHQRGRSLERGTSGSVSRVQSLRSGSTDGRMEGERHEDSAVEIGRQEKKLAQAQQQQQPHQQQQQQQQQPHYEVEQNEGDDVMRRAESQLKELQAFSFQLQSDQVGNTSHSATGRISMTDESGKTSVNDEVVRVSTPPPPQSSQNSAEWSAQQPTEFRTPPRRQMVVHSPCADQHTPSPHTPHLQYTPSPHAGHIQHTPPHNTGQYQVSSMVPNQGACPPNGVAGHFSPSSVTNRPASWPLSPHGYNSDTANTQSISGIPHNMVPQTGAATSGRLQGVEEDSVLSGDYPEQTGLSANGIENQSAGDESWLLEVPDRSLNMVNEEYGDSVAGRWPQSEDVQWATTSTGTSVAQHTINNQSTHSLPESPTSKLHRLLTESRQMVQSLERSTYPPFFPKEPLSPIKAEAGDE